jgi:GST-like protein
MESGAILIYLAEKYNLLLPKDPELKSLVIQWLFFQIGHIGPMFGQFGHFYRYGRDHCDHPYPIERYTKESKRLLGVLETQLSATSNCIAGEYSIADIAILPWVNCLEQFYNAGDLLALNQYQALRAWQSRLNKREAVQKGSDVGK